MKTRTLLAGGGLALVVAMGAAWLHRDTQALVRRHAAHAAERGAPPHAQTAGAIARGGASAITAPSRPAGEAGAELATSVAGDSSSASGGGRGAPPARAPLADATLRRLAPIARQPELYSLHTQVYVHQQQLMFAGLMQRLQFTAEQRASFDALNGEHQQRLLEIARAAEAGDPLAVQARRAVDQEMEARRRALFGLDEATWREQLQLLSHRSVVNQIAQQNVQGPGFLDPAATAALAQLIAQHSPPPVTAANTAPATYDWDAILAQAAGLLTPDQLRGVATSVEYYRAQREMQALTK